MALSIYSTQFVVATYAPNQDDTPLTVPTDKVAIVRFVTVSFASDTAPVVFYVDKTTGPGSPSSIVCLVAEPPAAGPTYAMYDMHLVLDPSDELEINNSSSTDYRDITVSGYLLSM